MQNFQTGFIIAERYSIEKLLGEGANGKVYLAQDLDLSRPVAIKILNLNASSQDGDYALARFEREAKALSQLLHTNIVKVFRYGVMEDETPYLVMEYLEGETLRDLIERKKLLNCNEAVEIALQICAALEYAHTQGIVHRDLKPENIILSGSAKALNAKILDFGLAKETDPKAPQKTLTETGFLVGTALYMSPEQCLGTPVDFRTDIYSFGCVLYELITGTAAFKSDSISNTLFMHLNVPLPAILELCPSCGLPQELDDLIVKCGAIDKDKRYQSFSQIQQVLEEIKALNCVKYFDPEQAKRHKQTNKLLKSFRRLPKQAILISMISILAILGLVAAYMFSGDAGTIRLALLTQQWQTPVEASISLKNTLQKTLASGKTKLAADLVTETTRSERFGKWNALARYGLFDDYIGVYEASKMPKKAFALKLDLLQQMMDTSKRRRQEKNNVDPAEQEQVDKLAHELLEQHHSKPEWTQISITVERNSGVRRALTDGLWVGVLRCEGLRRRDGFCTQDKAKDMAKYFRSVIDAAGRTNQQAVVDKLAPELLSIVKQYNLGSEELMLHCIMARDYVARAEFEKARAELRKVDALSADNYVSRSDDDLIERIRVACKEGKPLAQSKEEGERYSITNAIIFGDRSGHKKEND